MEEHNGWVRYTEDPKELLTIEDYYSQYIPRMKEIKDNSFAEQAEEMTKELPLAVSAAVENGLKHLEGDFFIEVIVKADRRFEGLYKNIVVARPTCPSPSYERIAYQYHRNVGEIELLWIIPTLSRCLQYQKQSHLDIKSDDRMLAEFAFQYIRGELDNLERKRNSELKPKKVLITGL